MGSWESKLSGPIECLRITYNSRDFLHWHHSIYPTIILLLNLTTWQPGHWRRRDHRPRWRCWPCSGLWVEYGQHFTLWNVCQNTRNHNSRAYFTLVIELSDPLFSELRLSKLNSSSWLCRWTDESDVFVLSWKRVFMLCSFESSEDFLMRPRKVGRQAAIKAVVTSR